MFLNFASCGKVDDFMRFIEPMNTAWKNAWGKYVRIKGRVVCV